MISKTQPKPRQARVSRRSVDKIYQSPENESLYRRDDPEMVRLAKSIKKSGIREPIVITSEGWIISGHRRHVAAILAGLKTVPVRVLRGVNRNTGRDKFVRLLREFNMQRVKTRAEALAEEAVDIDPDTAYASLLKHRRESAREVPDTIPIRGRKHRCAITDAKRPLLDAIEKVIDGYRDYWPLSVRQIHYLLLNNPPLMHASKPGSVYTNDQRSYRNLVNLLTRARIAGDVAMQAIDDPTRPVGLWPAHATVQSYVRQQLDMFSRGYWRDLMQGQPNHIEIVGEKNTIGGIIEPIARKYTIPYTLGRGFCSLPPRHAMVQRFNESGKDRLVLLVLTDFDPDGLEIAHSLGRSIRDDFSLGYPDIVDTVRVALTSEQVDGLELPAGGKAKPGSPNYRRFVKQYGDGVFELEAVEPTVLQRILEDAILGTIDTEAFNYEVDQERQDSVFLAATTRRLRAAILDGSDDPK